MEKTYRGLGFDPTPGELDAVTQVIAQLGDAAEALAEVAPGLRRAGEVSQDWHGAAAEAFRARLTDVPARLDAKARSLRQAATALDRWAEVLIANKRRTEELDEHAVRLRKRIQLARDLLQDKQNAHDLAATSAALAGAAAEVTAASTVVGELEAALDEVLDSARALGRDHHRAADAVADELAVLRGVDVPRQAPAEAAGRRLGELLGRASHTSAALAGLLTPAGRLGGPLPSGAAGAFAAGLSSSGGTTRR